MRASFGRELSIEVRKELQSRSDLAPVAGQVADVESDSAIIRSTR